MAAPAVSGAAALLLFTGCATQPASVPAQDTTKFTLEQSDRFLVFDKSLQEVVTCTGLQNRMLADGRMEVGPDWETLIDRQIREAIEEVAIQARRSEFVDQASGVSVRLTIALLSGSYDRLEDLLAKLGFEEEGYARSYLKIAGRWQDLDLRLLLDSATGAAALNSFAWHPRRLPRAGLIAAQMLHPDGSLVDAGAVTRCSGAGSCNGQVVSTTNSMVGGAAVRAIGATRFGCTRTVEILEECQRRLAAIPK